MAAHGFSHLTARKRVRVSTSGGFRNPRRRTGPTGDASGGRGTRRTGSGVHQTRSGNTGGSAGGGGGTGGGGTGKPTAVQHVMRRRKALGKAVTRQQARQIVKKNIRSDKRHAAYKYDFAGDGSGKKDKDYGTKRWRKSMKRHGWTDKTNHKNHTGGNGNKGDNTNSADDAGNSQSGDSYGGPQSLSAAERKDQRDARRRRRNKNRRTHTGSSG